MWQRYNQATKIFELSDDNGANWSPMPLDASILTEGILHIDRIPNLSAAKIASGEFDINRIPTLTKAKQHAQTVYQDSVPVFTGEIRERSRTTPLGDWLTYTPVWSSSGTQPAIGNGVLYGKYTLIGKTCIGAIQMNIGSTTTFGTGTYTWSLPLTASAMLPASVGGAALVFNSGVAFYTGKTFRTSGTAISAIRDAGQNIFGQTNPHNWKNGDYLQLEFIYDIL